MGILLGHLKVAQSKEGREYFKGTFQNMPVLGFHRKKDPAVVDVILDTDKVAWLADRENAKNPGGRE